MRQLNCSFQVVRQMRKITLALLDGLSQLRACSLSHHRKNALKDLFKIACTVVYINALMILDVTCCQPEPTIIQAALIGDRFRALPIWLQLKVTYDLLFYAFIQLF